jgi:hypothetical protein
VAGVVGLTERVRANVGVELVAVGGVRCVDVMDGESNIDCGVDEADAIPG